MKKLVLIAIAVMLFTVPAQARGYRGNICNTAFGSIMNECVVHPAFPSIDDNEHGFDYGGYLQFVLWEDKKGNIEVGNFNSYEIQRNEFTTMFGAKVYLNRLTYQKK